MARLPLYLAIVLALGCQREPSSSPTRQSTDSPAAAALAEATPLPNPWTPNAQRAQFSARTADSWDDRSLTLEALDVGVETREGYAITTLDVRVSNPSTEQVEAQIDLPIPPGAAVTGAMLWMGDRPMKGLLLPAARGREVYNRIVNRRRDPLLVSWKDGDFVSLAIFPMEPVQTRRFALTWVEPIAGGHYRVPALYHRGQVVSQATSLTVDGVPINSSEPWIEVPQRTPRATGDFRLAFGSAPPPAELSLLIDTAGTTEPVSLDEQWQLIGDLVENLDGKTTLHLFAGDWLLESLGSATSRKELQAARTRARDRLRAGLFDADHLVSELRLKKPTSAGIVIISSRYIPPVASARGLPLHALARERERGHRDAFDASGGSVATSGTALARGLRRPEQPADDGYHWVPAEAASGDTVWVGHRRDAAIDFNAETSPIEAIFYRAMLRRADIPANKIVSPATSILVLESEADYRRWGLKREGGANVRAADTPTSTISELLERGVSPGQAFDELGVGQSPTASRWAPIGNGALGTVGHGADTGSGYGYGQSRGQRRVVRISRVRFLQPTVEGALNKEVIRRYIRRWHPRFRHCYETQLQLRDDINGPALAEFTINPNGMTVDVSISVDHEHGAEVAQCIKIALQKLQFPKPIGGGSVRVRYPFELSPGPGPLWARANQLVDAGGADVNTKLAAQFDYEGATDTRSLVDWLATNRLRESGAPLIAYTTLGRMLRSGASDGDRDARRILSEAIPLAAEAVAKQFETWGFTDDAERTRHHPSR